MLDAATLRPLHGSGATGGNLFQRINDSQTGVIVATFMHTFGALLFTGGLILYVYQARLVHAAKEHKAVPSLHLLPYAHVMTLVGISLNGAGGLMRLYESDHPHIDQLGTSLWVQVLFVKHLFLLVGVGLAVYLTYLTHNLRRSDEAPQNFFPHTARITRFAAASFATILLASVLGAVATSQPLPMAGDAHAGMTNNPGTSASGIRFLYTNSSGVLTGSAAMPDQDTIDVGVPADATEILVTLSWTDSPKDTFDVALKNPAGNAVGNKQAAAGRITVNQTAAIEGGTWHVIVSSTQSFQAPYTLRVRVTAGSQG